MPKGELTLMASMSREQYDAWSDFSIEEGVTISATAAAVGAHLDLFAAIDLGGGRTLADLARDISFERREGKTIRGTKHPQAVKSRERKNQL